jgi:hypothetical protein
LGSTKESVSQRCSEEGIFSAVRAISTIKDLAERLTAKPPGLFVETFAVFYVIDRFFARVMICGHLRPNSIPKVATLADALLW